MGRAVLLMLLVLFTLPACATQKAVEAEPATEAAAPAETAPVDDAEAATVAKAEPAEGGVDEAAQAEPPTGVTEGEALPETPSNAGGKTLLYGTAALEAHLLATIANDPAFGEAMKFYKERNWTEAARRFAVLGDGGNMWARVYLGEMYAYGRGLPRNDQAAVEWLRPAALAGLSPAQLALAEVLERPGPLQDVSSAAVFYRFAAPDLPRARYRLALLFLSGSGVPPRPDLAAGLAHSAAQEGVPDAMVLFAHLLGEGIGIKPSRAEAVRWLQRAAWMTSPDNGPMPTDPAEVLAWTRAAANNGNVAGQLALGMMLARGIGVPADPREGAFWLEQAGLRYRAMGSAHGTTLALLELSLVRPDSPVIPRIADLVMPAEPDEEDTDAAAARSALTQSDTTPAHAPMEEEAVTSPTVAPALPGLNEAP